MIRRPSYVVLLALPLATSLPACAWLIGFPDYEIGSSGSGGSGGTGSGGGGVTCEPLAKIPCYTGPDGSKGVGPCHAGLAVCNESGTALGPCEGEVVPAPEKCTSMEDLDCNGSVGCSGKTMWLRRFGDAEQRGQSVAVGAMGDVFAIGRFGGAIDLGDGPLVSGEGVADAFVAKRRPDGTSVWSRAINGLEAGGGRAIAVNAAGAVVVTGTLIDGADRNVFLARLDGSDMGAGAVVWQKSFGDASVQSGQTVAVDDAGSIAVVGDFTGTLDFDGEGGKSPLVASGQQDAFVARFDAGGALLWARRLGGSGTTSAHAGGVAIDPTGAVVVLGEFTGTVDIGTGPLVSQGKDLFLGKYDAAGAPLFGKRFGDAKDQNARGVTAGIDGSIVVTGGFWGTLDFGGSPITSDGASMGSDIFVARLAADGTVVYAKSWGDDFHIWCSGRDVAMDAAGNVALTGEFGGTIAFGATTLKTTSGSGAFFAALDPAGNVVWAKGLPGSGNNINVGRGVAFDSKGDVALTGDFQSTIDFGNGPVVAAELAGYVMKLNGQTGDPWVDPLSGNSVWPLRVDDSDEQDRAAAVDSKGRVLVTGFFGGALHFAKDPVVSEAPGIGNDGFLAALDSSGTSAFAVRFGGAKNQQPTGLAALPDGGSAVTGTFDGAFALGDLPVLASVSKPDVFVARFGADGAPQQSALLALVDDGAFSEPWICADSKGNVAVSVNFYGKLGMPVTAIGPGGSTSNFVGKLAPDGTWAWATVWGHGSGTHTAARCTFDAAGNLLLVGTLVPDNAANDAIMAKLDPDGKLLWERKLGDSGDQTGAIAAPDADGSFIATGRVNSGKIQFTGPTDDPACADLTSPSGTTTWVARFGSDGGCKWALSVSGGNGGQRLALTPAGDILVLRASSNALAVDKLDPSGKPIWSQSMQGTSGVTSPGLAADAFGDALVTATFSGSLTHPTLGQITSVGGNDFLVMKLAP